MWTAVHRGVYSDAVSVAALTAQERHRLNALAVAARSPQLVLSHISAATLFQLPTWGLHSSNYFKLNKLQKLLDDPQVAILLVNVKSRYYAKKVRLCNA